MIISGPCLNNNDPEIVAKLNSITPRIAAKDHTHCGAKTQRPLID
jgi:hypothetical protein